MGTSTDANPTYQYTTPGVYDVTLTVYGLGGTASYTRSGYITITTPELVVSLGTIVPADTATLTGLGTYAYNSVGTIEATPVGGVGIDYADIVFLVPQPDTMQSSVQTGVPLQIAALEAALIADGIGAGATPNNYALVGFMDGTTSPVDKPTKKSVGGADWGTSAELITAIGALTFPFTFASQKSDGYYASEFALDNYTFRSGAPKIFVLYSAKGRQDITSGAVTDATSSAALTAANVILNVMLENFTILDVVGADHVFARIALTSPTIIEDGSPPYYVNTGVFDSWFDVATLPPQKVITYAPWCGALNGYIWAWDEGGYTGFNNAFGELNSARVTAQLGTNYVFDYFVLNGGSNISTNPYLFNVVTDTVVDVYMTVPAPVPQISTTLSGGGLGWQDTGVRTYLGHGFTTVGAFAMTSIDLLMTQFPGTSGTIHCQIYAAAAGVPTGSALATATNTVDGSTLNAGSWPNGSPPTPVTFTFADFPLSAATEYAIVFHATGFGGLAFAVISGSPSVGFNVYGSSDGVTWPAYTYTNYRFYFVIYGY